ncbi:ACR155Wp [Eremothecium gossypii ATCC 10895]|uniref:Ribonucleoside-diphosphate reductase n=1 Tax=Eremothecium gossypii (strain ATCC 10895 / CBS 109.51 / FGSC 9923 / NRRL Y-1056) TaxID=284811 RepID=Q75BW6_EREGS|nr:ACR155Wp [Eremothecium gossypii ATCC 10895]AAS51381.1 ACR155Wp [Eremothecium gossypii ATCC 10895]
MAEPKKIFIISDDSGLTEAFDERKLLESLRKLQFGLKINDADIDKAVKRIAAGIGGDIRDSELVAYIGETLASMITRHPDFSLLAARVEIKVLHKRLLGLGFTGNLAVLCESGDSPEGHATKRKRAMSPCTRGPVRRELYDLAVQHRNIIDQAIDDTLDFTFTYFGWKTLCKSYLLKHQGRVHETPQYMFMRVALALHGPSGDIDRVLETYRLMANKYFIHASPTLFNAGTTSQFLSSCFLLGIHEDSIDGIYNALHKAALISKASGGIGIHVSDIRANGSYISGTNGTSNGLVPMLSVFNSTARYVDQGGNKRPGAFCIYLEPWHADVFDFLRLRRNHGKEEMRARDLFYGLWIPDLFMKRVENNGEWSLFSPNEAVGLSDCYGEAFEQLYVRYERELEPYRRVKAQELWREILLSQTETGGPFMLYKDACNSKSNQKNLGTIKSSNLCCEIVEYSSRDEVAVCNLASVALPTFVSVTSDAITFDYARLHSVVKVMTRNLDKAIDIGDYPVPEAERSNKKHRPLALGVQGLADVFMLMRFPFNGEEAAQMNREIFETIYHAAVETSIELAAEYGVYASFVGSPASKGELQFDLWGRNKDNYQFLYDDWDELKEKIKSGPGLRNSLLVGPMPTASTSQILGFTESFEPMTSMIYTRRVLSGEYTLVNKYMVQDFCDLGIWSEELKNRIIKDGGSIQGIDGIPPDLKDLYKTVWELPQRKLIDLSADRAPFVDQSQSLNLFLKEPTMGKLTSMHFYAWKKGLKTGMYYLRTQAAANAIQFTLTDENTLSGPVKLREGAAVAQSPRHARYPSEEAGSRVSPARIETAVSSMDPSDDSDANNAFGIYDSTPIACSTENRESCDSCSG